MAKTRPLHNVEVKIEIRQLAGQIDANGHRLRNGSVSANRRINSSCPCPLHYYITLWSEKWGMCHCCVHPEPRAPFPRWTAYYFLHGGMRTRSAGTTVHLALGCTYIMTPPLQAAWAAVSTARQTEQAPAVSQKSPTLDWPFHCLWGDLWFRTSVSHRQDDEAATKWQETLT